MSPQLNHTIVWCRDQKRSAGFLTQVLGLQEPRRFLHFLVVEMANGVSLDYYEKSDPIALQHYAFLVGEEEFDAIFARIRERGLPIWADPARTQPGEINHHFGGARRLFRGSRRASAGDHHPPVRQRERAASLELAKRE